MEFQVERSFPIFIYDGKGTVFCRLLSQRPSNCMVLHLARIDGDFKEKAVTDALDWMFSA
jgi:hypothetical protein